MEIYGIFTRSWAHHIFDMKYLSCTQGKMEIPKGNAYVSLVTADAQMTYVSGTVGRQNVNTLGTVPSAKLDTAFGVIFLCCRSMLYWYKHLLMCQQLLLLNRLANY